MSNPNGSCEQALVLTTDRLIIRQMDEHDAPFIINLVNDPDWLRYIGDRNVKTIDDARNYILSGPMAMRARHGFGFDVVETKGSSMPIGICGLARRDYLDDVDIGFAFLPQFRGRGYALEAARAVLHHAQAKLGLRRVVATTRPENSSSAQLLERLGLAFERLIRHPTEDRELRLYGADFVSIL